MGNKRGVISSRNPLYWKNKGYSESESVKMAKSRMPGTVEYFNIFKGLSVEEAEIESKNYYSRNSNTLKNFIDKFGECDGRRRWDDYVKSQSVSNTFEYKRDKYGWSLEDFERFNKSRSITIENMIGKYGVDIGTKKYEEYIEKQKYAGCKLEYFIEKYGEAKGTQIYLDISFRKSGTFESYLVKFGGDEEKAMLAYSNRKLVGSAGISLIANELFDSLYTSCIELGYSKVFYYNNMQEWWVFDSKSNRKYFLDFYLKETKRGIEFNGDYWHANPVKYNPDTIIDYPNDVKRPATSVWELDAYKLEVFKSSPFVEDVLVVWESEYKNNKQKILEKCLKFLMQ